MKHKELTAALTRSVIAGLVCAALSASPSWAAQDSGTEGAGAERPTFQDASLDVDRRLEAGLAELAELRERLAEEKLPLARTLNDLERELSTVREEYQSLARLLEGRQLDLGNLTNELSARRTELDYLSNLLSEYARNFESRLHIAEFQRYEEVLDRARLAPDDANSSQAEVLARQVELVDAALERLFDAGAGTRFNGRAVDSQGLVRPGTFVLLGSAAVFRSADGEVVGTVEQRVGSLEPTVVPFASPEIAARASSTVALGRGPLPIDPTLGDAHRIEATDDTLVEHIKKGGPVMVPILSLAALALLVAIGKWIHLTLVRKPSRNSLEALFAAVARRDESMARAAVARVKGPVGRMLAEGVEHMREPRELIEEVMYETVLATKLRLQRFIPFIAVAAAAAPLLGLLGTVTGIINTFKMLTVYGSGDVKSLSGGISEALITTKFGLIVAIPALLLHAFLSRKAGGIVSRMEANAVRFANEASRSTREAPPLPIPARHRDESPAAARTDMVHAS